jgi:hypothetical protein
MDMGGETGINPASVLQFAPPGGEGASNGNVAQSQGPGSAPEQPQLSGGAGAGVGTGDGVGGATMTDFEQAGNTLLLEVIKPPFLPIYPRYFRKTGHCPPPPPTPHPLHVAGGA